MSIFGVFRICLEGFGAHHSLKLTGGREAEPVFSSNTLHAYLSLTRKRDHYITKFCRITSTKRWVRLAQKVSSKDNRVKELLIQIKQLREREKTIRELRQSKESEALTYIAQEYLANPNEKNLEHYK